MIKIFKEHGVKTTSQREKIYNYLLSKGKVQIKDIIHDNSEIDPSTIYRIIDLLCDKDIAIKIIEKNDIYYVINSEVHKHYLECDVCHKKEKLLDCPYNHIDLKGFKIIEKTVIRGVCQECQQKNIKYGIFVGSFNPPTNAHFGIGELLLDKQLVDKIVYVPCNSLAKKNFLIDINLRYKMISEYIKDKNNFLVNDIEIKNGRNIFSYRDMDLLKQEYGNNLYIIIGSDNFLDIDKWELFEYLLENYYFIVINRNSIDVESVIKEKYAKYQTRFINVPYSSDISSTMVRDRIKDGSLINDIVPLVIYDIINKNNLFHD